MCRQVLLFSLLFTLSSLSYSHDLDAVHAAEKRCRYSGEFVIAVAEAALEGEQKRPNRAARLRKHVARWRLELMSRKDPCVVYADIESTLRDF